MAPLDQQILTTLDDEGSVHVVDLAAELDEHPATVDRQCYELQHDGLIRQTGGGIYTLTSEGKTTVTEVDLDR